VLFLCLTFKIFSRLFPYICSMRITVFFIVFSLGLLCSWAQNPIENEISKENDTTTVIDTKYREDQFYASITYNLLETKPNGVSQSGFSSGFHVGFIRDLPINKRRNVAIGIGLGISANSYNQTLLIAKNDNAFVYSVLNDNIISFTKNKFSTYVLEFPMEFRWRTSTATEYSFWRIYTGIKLGYVVLNSSKFKSPNGDLKYTNIDDFNALQYGLTFSAGYSNINFHIYYSLNDIFDKNAKINGSSIDMSAVKIGLMFYIL